MAYSKTFVTLTGLLVVGALLVLLEVQGQASFDERLAGLEKRLHSFEGNARTLRQRLATMQTRVGELQDVAAAPGRTLRSAEPRSADPRPRLETPTGTAFTVDQFTAELDALRKEIEEMASNVEELTVAQETRRSDPVEAGATSAERILEVSPDGLQILTTDGATVRIWNAADVPIAPREEAAQAPALPAETER